MVVTGDVGDFVSLGARRLPDKRPHIGLVLGPRQSFPRARHGFGRIIRSLDALLRAHPGDEDLVSDVIWLTHAPGDLTEEATAAALR